MNPTAATGGGRVIAILGAESTGKSTLAVALAPALQALTGLRVTAVDEWLRTWCEQQGRTPRREEQRAIALEQARRIEEARRTHDWVVADTTPVMTAVYSRLVFGDDSLTAEAVALHRRYELTLLTGIDLPWQADGLQRDGPHVREQVMGHLREMLLGSGLGWSTVTGQGPARLARALDAVTRRVQAHTPPVPGLLTRLQSRDAEQPAWHWACENCDDPACERRSLSLVRSAGY